MVKLWNRKKFIDWKRNFNIRIYKFLKEKLEIENVRVVGDVRKNIKKNCSCKWFWNELLEKSKKIRC